MQTITIECDTEQLVEDFLWWVNSGHAQMGLDLAANEAEPAYCVRYKTDYKNRVVTLTSKPANDPAP